MPPKVSVAIITYNHEAYIRAALDSVLAQQTPFDFEIVVGEDCSTDNTRQIVSEYQRRYPDKIRLLLADHNQGAAFNLANTIQSCRGDTIALLEGDDYWIDPHKLQKQADYLDNHPNCTSCFHNTLKLAQDSGEIGERNAPAGRKPIYGLTDLLSGAFMPSGATIFRNRLFGDFPDWYYSVKADFVLALHVLNAQHGDIGYLDEDMSVYREHPGGLWSGASWLQQCKWNTATFELFDRHLGFKYSRLIQITRLYWRAAVVCGTYHEDDNARRFIAKALLAYPRDQSVSLPRLVGTWLQFYVPPVHRVALRLKRILRPRKNSPAHG